MIGAYNAIRRSNAYARTPSNFQSPAAKATQVREHRSSSRCKRDRRRRHVPQGTYAKKQQRTAEAWTPHTSTSNISEPATASKSRPPPSKPKTTHFPFPRFAQRRQAWPPPPPTDQIRLLPKLSQLQLASPHFVKSRLHHRQHLLVQKHNRIQRLILRRTRHLPLRREKSQKLYNTT